MTMVKHQRQSVRPGDGPASRKRVPPSRPLPIGVAVVAVSVALLAATTTRAGSNVLAAAFRFLEFYSGVFSLVALSLAVMGGLVATDRAILLIRHRILLQEVHRALAMTAMIFLVVHISTKVIEGHSRPVDLVVPFLAGHRRFYVGLGTVAGYLMVAIVWTGVARGHFAGTGRPWVWRVLHGTAYLAWPVALAHGLESGRHAKSWVMISYTLCLILVGFGLLVRVGASWGRWLRVPKAHAVHAAGRHAKVAAPAGPTSSAGSFRRAPAAGSPVAERGGAVPVAERGRPVAVAERARPAAVWVQPRSTPRSDTPTFESSDEEFWSYLRTEVRR